MTDDDAFMSLSSSAQALYLHLNMAADDDGFCNQVAICMFRAHASVQDLEALLEKRYVYQFENGVIVIRHWRMANALRKDRYTKTIFQSELEQLMLNDNNEYVWLPDGCQMVAERLPDGCQVVATGKDRIGKDRLGQDSNKNYSSLSVSGRILNHWNALQTLGIKPIRMINGKREESVRARIRQYGEDAFIEAIEKIRESDFLQGKNSRGWTITFDWLILPSNFPKVLEGNYDNSNHQQQDKYSQRMEDIGSWGKQFEE